MAKFFKVTEEMLEDDKSLDSILGKLENKPREMIDELLSRKKSELINCLENCESPIEMMLALAFIEENVINAGRNLGADVVAIDNQREITIGDTTYRADFILPVYFNKYGFGKEYVIECNGHEFHERTKEQVIKDNRRQRDLISSGYTVINFSGSEIYNDPQACAREVRNIINSHTKEVARQHGG